MIHPLIQIFAITLVAVIAVVVAIVSVPKKKDDGQDLEY